MNNKHAEKHSKKESTSTRIAIKSFICFQVGESFLETKDFSQRERVRSGYFEEQRWTNKGSNYQFGQVILSSRDKPTRVPIINWNTERQCVTVERMFFISLSSFFQTIAMEKSFLTEYLAKIEINALISLRSHNCIIKWQLWQLEAIGWFIWKFLNLHVKYTMSR